VIRSSLGTKALYFAPLLTLLLGCSRAAPDATPDGAVRLFVDRMEASADDPRAIREAYALMGPRARTNLKDRADRASRGQGHRYEPHEMLAEGRFGLTFRPKTMSAKVDGDTAFVEVLGEGPDERATVHCVHEANGWRVEPALPELVAPQKRADDAAPR
jgi:hypothetical protein